MMMIIINYYSAKMPQETRPQWGGSKQNNVAN